MRPTQSRDSIDLSHLVIQEWCPYCQAEPGHPCVSEHGNVKRLPHTQRHKHWARAELYRERGEILPREGKWCTKCKRQRPLEDFSRDKQQRDGLRAICRECSSAAGKEHRKRNPLTPEQRARQSEVAKAWRAANRERSAAGNHAYRQRHRDRQRARQAVMNALNRGEITRQPCEVCGTTEDVHAHHDDYTSKLDVRWLCRTHHNEVHRQMRQAAS